MNPNYTGGRIDALNSTTDPANTPTLYVCGGKYIIKQQFLIISSF